ncbi:MAG: hypothetical protein ACTS6P_01605 [Candidatus Hodgkinia cicadicola]
MSICNRNGSVKLKQTSLLHLMLIFRRVKRKLTFEVWIRFNQFCLLQQNRLNQLPKITTFIISHRDPSKDCSL